MEYSRFSRVLKSLFYEVLISGAQISALQMSMYIWSILGTGVCLWALKQIRDVYSGLESV